MKTVLKSFLPSLFILLPILGLSGQAGATNFGNISQMPITGAPVQQAPVVLGIQGSSWIDMIFLTTAGTAVTYTIPTDASGVAARAILMNCTNPAYVSHNSSAITVPTSSGTAITNGTGGELSPVLRSVIAVSAISIMPTVSGTVCSIAVYK